MELRQFAVLFIYTGFQGITGGSCLSCTTVKLDSHLDWIFFAKFPFMIKLIIIIG